MKSGNLNLLEPSGPLQACNGTALALLYNVFMIKPLKYDCCYIYIYIYIYMYHLF